MEVLYTSAAMSTAINKVLFKPEQGDRRVAIVAYVGADAEKYLPDPIGLQVVCDLKPGATSESALRALAKRGAKIYRADKLHMKVYWSSRNGCVIGSSNASRSAQGKNGLIEAGVFLEPGIVDIDRLLQEANPKLIAEADLQKLLKATVKLTWATGSGARDSKAEDFRSYCHSGRKHDWKLSWWDTECSISKNAKAQSKASFGIAEPYDFLNVAKNEIKKEEWILHFNSTSFADVGWLYAEFVVDESKDEEAYEKKYPQQAVQAKHPKYGHLPPFDVKSKKFKKAFEESVAEFGVKKLTSRGAMKPPKAFLALLLSKFEE